MMAEHFASRWSGHADGLQSASLAGLQAAEAYGRRASTLNAHIDQMRAEIVHNVVDKPRIWSHGWFT